jgi:hypothetical protein
MAMKHDKNGIRNLFTTHSGLLLIFTLLQVMFWNVSNRLIPDMEIVPELATDTEAHLIALGDDQFYFRWHAFNIQNAGWTYGRFTALEKYDYHKLHAWFTLLDQFDNESNFVPALASYFYSRTGNVKDLAHLVKYLQEYSRYRLEQNWFWQVEGVHIADHKMNDRDIALEMALPLLNLHEVPIIVRQLPAFIYERRGEMELARNVMEEIKADTVLAEAELNFMTHFLETRLKKHNSQTLYFDNRKPYSVKAD